MPKAQNASQTVSKTMIVLQHGAKRVIVPRPTSYSDAINEAGRHFTCLPKSMIRFETDALDFLEGQAAEVSPQVWNDVLPLVSVLKISIDSGSTPSESTFEFKSSLDTRSVSQSKSPKRSNSLPELEGWQELSDDNANHDSVTTNTLASGPRSFPVSPPTTHAAVHKDVIPGSHSTLPITIQENQKLFAPPPTFDLRSDPLGKGGPKFYVSVLNCEGKRMKYSVDFRTRAFEVLEHATRQWELEPGSARLIYNGSRVLDRTLGELGVIPDTIFQMLVSQTGGKPVIYLFPPEETTISAHVELDLVPKWSFSALYPPTPIRTLMSASGVLGGEMISWDVEAQPGGNLVDKRTGCEMAYLFWEAEASLPMLPEPPSYPPVQPPGLTNEKFDPTTSDLTAQNSVLLPIADVPRYLDATLKSLGLHVEARTSFITYWLPSLSKHTHVALQFVPQHSYEQAAPLRITPQPDVITRVFMLFKGVKGDDIGSRWADALVRAKEDVHLWRQIVGVKDVEGITLSTLFRVLEWGGMEVVRR